MSLRELIAARYVPTYERAGASDAFEQAFQEGWRWRAFDTLISTADPDAWYWSGMETAFVELGLRAAFFDGEENEGFGGPVRFNSAPDVDAADYDWNESWLESAFVAPVWEAA